MILEKDHGASLHSISECYNLIKKLYGFKKLIYIIVFKKFKNLKIVLESINFNLSLIFIKFKMHFFHIYLNE